MIINYWFIYLNYWISHLCLHSESNNDRAQVPKRAQKKMNTVLATGNVSIHCFLYCTDCSETLKKIMYWLAFTFQYTFAVRQNQTILMGKFLWLNLIIFLSQKIMIFLNEYFFLCFFGELSSKWKIVKNSKSKKVT